ASFPPPSSQDALPISATARPSPPEAERYESFRSLDEDLSHRDSGELTARASRLLAYDRHAGLGPTLPRRARGALRLGAVRAAPGVRLAHLHGARGRSGVPSGAGEVLADDARAAHRRR